MNIILIFMLAFHLNVYAQTSPVKPVVETVPKPSVENTEPVQDTTEKVPETGVDKEDLGLIKTEKTIVDKSCKMVNGEVKCKHKKKVKKKSL